MSKRIAKIILNLSVLLACSTIAFAQTSRTVEFSTQFKGEDKAISNWGIDATWVNFYNAKASSRNAGDQIDFIRIGFYLHEPTNRDGSLSAGQIKKLDKALKFVDMVDAKMPIMLSPNNEEGIIDWYKNPNGSARVDLWYNVIARTKAYVESKGHPVIALEVFNEPDWKKWNMGGKADGAVLSRMCGDLNVDRIGPSTLSTGNVVAWYKGIRSTIEGGSTHTLGGTMQQYVEFIRGVKQDGKPFMNPEVHSLVEVIVGAEVGVDSACWWDQINKGRAAFMKACQGKRLAFVAVPDNWSAGCVYRGPDDVLYGFASTNERQNGVETVYGFVCTDEDVTYYPNGDTEEEGVFVKKGEPFVVQAKVKGKDKKSITKWFTIIPQK